MTNMALFATGLASAWAATGITTGALTWWSGEPEPFTAWILITIMLAIAGAIFGLVHLIDYLWNN